MALKVQRGGEHLDSVHREHGPADFALRLADCAFPMWFLSTRNQKTTVYSGEPSQQNRTLSDLFWLRPQAALGHSASFALP